jgi:hypothetical protein
LVHPTIDIAFKRQHSIDADLDLDVVVRDIQQETALALGCDALITGERADAAHSSGRAGVFNAAPPHVPALQTVKLKLASVPIACADDN